MPIARNKTSNGQKNGQKSRRDNALKPSPEEQLGTDPGPVPESVVRDDLLRLVFTTCHPVLTTESRVALTLRLLGGLTTGDVVILGRIMPASNHTFACEVVDGVTRIQAVYKPVSGERPLWDFTDGTLAFREYAAWVVSDALGWDVVPPTVLRNGPAGSGMVQLWCEPDGGVEPVDIVPEDAVPDGYLHVLDAVDDRDRPVALVHEDTRPLRRMAIFDVVVNNTDRKGGHVLAMADGHRFGVDHGVCFHTDDKLRTVLWGWAGDPLSDEETGALAALESDLADGALRRTLEPLLTEREIDRTAWRCRRLIAEGMLPIPSGGWPSIPWPPF